jgi:hypothetical protein
LADSDCSESPTDDVANCLGAEGDGDLEEGEEDDWLWEWMSASVAGR